MKTILLLLLLTGTAFTDIAPVQIDNDIFADFTPEDETTLDCSQTHSGANTTQVWPITRDPEITTDAVVWQPQVLHSDISEILIKNQKTTPNFFIQPPKLKTVIEHEKPMFIVPEPGVVAIVIAAIIALLYFRKHCSYLR
ncbi:MAG: hypothetical protein ACRC2T_20015 [Thermoguttaceae bacterium]